MNGISETEIPVVENLIFFNCAQTGDAASIKKITDSNGMDFISISTPLEVDGLPSKKRGTAVVELDGASKPLLEFVLRLSFEEENFLWQMRIF